MRGRRLLTPKGDAIRPTSDRVREAVFNLLGQDLDGRRVLDLFAGTGALGIESLSRGATWAVFVDHSPAALGLISRNLERCGLAQSATLIRHDLRHGPPSCAPARMRGLDVVFLDPPYGLGLIPPILNALSSCTGLDAEGVIVAETAARETLPLHDVTLQLVTKRRYGDTSIHIIAWNHELRAAEKAKPDTHETIRTEKTT